MSQCHMVVMLTVVIIFKLKIMLIEQLSIFHVSAPQRQFNVNLILLNFILFEILRAVRKF